MKKLLIVFAALVVVAGGTVSILRWLEVGPFSTQGDEHATPDPAAAEPSTPPVFVDVDPLLIPVFAEDSVASTVQIQVKLEVPARKEETVKRLMPKITDAFLRDLYVYVPRTLRRHDRLDLIALKGRLMRLARGVAGDDAVRNILIQSVMDNPQR